MNYNDVFNEHLVKKKTTAKDNLQKAGLIAAGMVLIAAAFMVVPSFALFVVLAVAAGEVYLLKRYNLEYEYVLTNNELDIDKIFSQSKRKRALSVDIRTFSVMIQVNNPNFKSEVGNIDMVEDYSICEVSESTYAAVYEKDGKRVQLLFDPSDAIVQGIKTYIPRKVK